MCLDSEVHESTSTSMSWWACFNSKDTVVKETSWDFLKGKDLLGLLFCLMYYNRISLRPLLMQWKCIMAQNFNIKVQAN